MTSRERRAVYGRARWRALRRVALDRDGWRCTRCGRAGRLEVHHLRPTADGGAMFDIQNVRTLCRDCHFREHAPAKRAQRLAAMAPGRRAWWERIGAAMRFNGM